MNVYYKGNEVDTTSKDQLSTGLLVKTVGQMIESKVFDDKFGIFTRKKISEGFQLEEIEVANLTPDDFDPTGANTLKKKKLTVASLYHKINRKKTFKTTVSDKQVRESMLSANALADLTNAITNELYNSSAIADYEAMKQLFVDIANEQKKMVICDLNGNDKPDALVKAIQTLATRMSLPSTEFNFLGFKKEFNSKEDLVLVIDASTEAILNVDSLANAFHMDKKALVSNIIVLDEMPKIEYQALAVKKGLELNIGEAQPIITYKENSSGGATVTGKAKCMLLNKKAIIRDPIERKTKMQENAEGDFYNMYLHATDMLSYSPLKNAVVLVD